MQWLQFNCGNIIADPMNKCSAASTFSPPHYGKVVGVELYDHDGDNANSFGDFENENLALRADHKDVVAQLHAELVAHWQPPAESE